MKNFKSQYLNSLTFGTPINLGAPIKDIQILGCCTVVSDDGSVIFYGVTSGPPAIFFSYDVNKEEVLYSCVLTHDGVSARCCYDIQMGNDGIINIATAGNCLYYRFNPDTNEIKCYGLLPTEQVMATGYTDCEGNHYFGTYPQAKLMKFDKKQEKLIDLGVMIPTGKYVRSMGGYKNKIFMGGMGNPTTQWVKYDIITNEKTVLKNPSLEGIFTQSDVANFYAVSTAGKYLFARCKISNLNMYYLCVFDMEKEEWIDFIPRTRHLHFTKFDGEIVYFHNYTDETMKEVALFSYNPETKEINRIEGITIPHEYLVSPEIVCLKDKNKYPGKTIIAGADTAGIALINLENKTVEYVKEPLPKQHTLIRTLKAGINNELILSAYMGSKFVVWDSESDKPKYEGKSLQIEGINVFDNKYYFGMYGSEAALREFDPLARENPVTLGDMQGAGQDRAFNITDAGDKIVWGAYPNYGKLGGAVAVYDKKERRTLGVYKPVENQAISGLVCRGNKIYGSTSVYGGLGIDAIDAPSNIFVMDINTGKVLNKKEVTLKTDKNRQYFVGNMIFDKNGNLWVACAKTLIKVDPETLEITDEIPIGEKKHELNVVWALPYSLEFDKKGVLYTNIGNCISAVDTLTKEVKILKELNTNVLSVAENGNIYFIDQDKVTALDKIEINYI